MKPTVLMHASVVSELLPVAGALLARDRLTPARRWVIAWCLLLVVEDGVNFVMASKGINNLWVGHIAAPLTGAVALWMLSLWQETRTSRLALRIAIPIFVAVSAALSLTVDDPTTFSMVAAPFHYLVLLFAALWTFVRRSLNQREKLATSGWFWILAGFMVYNGSSIAIQAVVWYLYDAGQAHLLQHVFDVRSLVQIAAFIVMAGGMLCPVPQTHSGSRFSPPP
jgi:hypothetical protein